MLAVLALSSDTAIHSATDFPSDSMVRNCIDVSKSWQPVGDKGKGKDKGRDIGKVKGKAEAKASAEDTSKAKHKSDVNIWRDWYGHRYDIPTGICLNRGHKCYCGISTHWSCNLILLGSLDEHRRRRAKAKAKAKAKAELVEIESDDVTFHSSDAEW